MTTTPSPTPRTPPTPEEVRGELAATVDALTGKLDVGTRARSGAHDAYQALADRHGARSIVLGGLVATVLGTVLVRKAVTR